MMGGKPCGYSLEIVDILVINVRISNSSLVTVGVHWNGVKSALNFVAQIPGIFRLSKSRVPTPLQCDELVCCS